MAKKGNKNNKQKQKQSDEVKTENLVQDEPKLNEQTTAVEDIDKPIDPAVLQGESKKKLEEANNVDVSVDEAKSSENTSTIDTAKLAVPQLNLNQQNQSTESLGEPIAVVESPPNVAQTKPKKRLTLQERLALAAKGKGKSKETSTPASSVPPSTQNSNVNSPTLSPVQDRIDGVAAIDSNSTISDENNQLKQRINQLESENKQLNDKIKSVPKSADNSNVQDLMKKLTAKDEAIDQLMKEGEALSIKELRLNDSIKKLKAKNSELEANLLDYSEKSQSSTMKLGELEDFLWANKFKNVQQLITNYSEMSKKLEDTSKKVVQEQSWQKKYSEQEKVLDKELQKSKDLGIELNDARVALEIIKQRHDLELDSKNTIIKDLKDEIASDKQLNNDEINRLENKIESLRLEKESVPQQNSMEGESKSIDFNEYTKMSENHHNLQQEYLSRQENWKLIESNLLGKIDTLSNSLEILKKSKLKTSNDIKKLNSSLNDMANKNKDLEEQLVVVKNEKQQLQLELEIKENDLNDLKEKSETFKSIYNNDKQNLEMKIKNLQDSLDSTRLASPRGSLSRGGGLQLDLDLKDYAPQEFELPSWDIKFGESSITPKVSSTQLYFDGSRRQSLNSISEDGEEDLDTMDEDDFSLNSRQPSYNQSFSNVQNGSNRNIQMLNKISATSRRLEVEINTLKEENGKLVLEKEEIQQSLLDKYKLVEEVDELKGQVEVLTQDLKKKDIQQKTMLELIGEKTEQVEELKADVEDLKDLCKLQVQQMVGPE